MTSTPRVRSDALKATHRFTRTLALEPGTAPAHKESGRGARTTAPRSFDPQLIKVQWDFGDQRSDWLVELQGPYIRSDGTPGYTDLHDRCLLSAAPAWLQEMLSDEWALLAQPCQRDLLSRYGART